VFRILKIVVNFIRGTCNLYAGLMEILNSQLRYNFSWAERQRQEEFVVQRSSATAHSFNVGICCY